jgi:hypothetical protein
METVQAERLERIRAELEALILKVDGRNARNGHCTWPEIRATLELVYSLLAGVLDGTPAGGKLPAAPGHETERLELRLLEELADDLRFRIASVRARM